MNRKILDVTMLCTLCICLMVAANIEEKNTIRESREEISSAYVISAADKAEVPVAGVCRVLSGEDLMIVLEVKKTSMQRFKRQ